MVYAYPEGYNDGKSVTLTPEQYTVSYENNTDAFAKSGVKAKAIVTPVMSEDGSTVVGDLLAGTRQSLLSYRGIFPGQLRRKDRRKTRPWL